MALTEVWQWDFVTLQHEQMEERETIGIKYKSSMVPAQHTSYIKLCRSYSLTRKYKSIRDADRK